MPDLQRPRRPARTARLTRLESSTLASQGKTHDFVLLATSCYVAWSVQAASTTQTANGEFAKCQLRKRPLELQLSEVPKVRIRYAIEDSRSAGLAQHAFL